MNNSMTQTAKTASNVVMPTEVDPIHWGSPEANDLAAEYATYDRSRLMMSDMSDFALANAQFLVSRYSLELIHYQTAAKERIRWLSVKLACATPAANSYQRHFSDPITAAESDWIARAVEALRASRGIVESDFENAKQYGDSDWIGESQEALEKIDALLSQVREVRG